MIIAKNKLVLIFISVMMLTTFWISEQLGVGLIKSSMSPQIQELNKKIHLQINNIGLPPEAVKELNKP